jgi:hypothetical protein
MPYECSFVFQETEESDPDTKEADVQLVDCTEEGCESQTIMVRISAKDGVMMVSHALKKDNVNIKITRMTFNRNDGASATALRVFVRK